MAGLDSKIRLALASATQETTLALASINFDFSLYKVEAPKEYQTLGGVLSKRRRDAAEGGAEHVFARRLGALFAQELPDTPHLIKAYGTRSSEIIQSPDVPASTARDSGVFQDWTGVDATSIWAAATSGKGALPVHLLACMLARMWSAPQAVAIWEELIRTRKRQLSSLNSDEPMHLPSLSAAAGDITREQMSRWDASARSWLAVADLVKRREQTQLMLIVKELGLSINQQEDVYASVFKAWKTALLTMENLISGISQSISDGAALLGLASWHLYPNIWAMNATSQRVGFHDNLIPHSTIVTLGKVSSSLECEVSWSLPLAYLRFYGDPIQTIGTLDEAGRRIPMQDAFYVALGAIFATWGKRGDDFHKACSFIVALADTVYNGYTSRTASSWLRYLGNSAESFLAADGFEKERYRSLISRGRGRHVGFLSGGEKINFPLFGIGTTRDVLSLLKDGDSHLAFLRLVAKSVRASPDQLLIRWRTEKMTHKITGHGDEDTFEFFDNEASRHGQRRSEWQYATALRPHNQTNKRKVDPDADMTGHFRWVERRDRRVGQDGEIWEDLKDVTVRAEHRRASSFEWEPVAGPSTEVRSRAVTNQFNYMLGTLEDAALFARADLTEHISDEPTVDLLITALQQNLFDEAKLIELLDGTRETSYGIVPSVSRGLRALAAAADAYKLTPGATIHTSVFSQPIQNGLWIPRYPNDSLPTRTNSVVIPEIRAAEQDNATANDAPKILRQDQLAIYILDRRQTFACIAYFENVSVNLDPTHLGGVMALASNNSIFVAMPLVCDPYDVASENEIKHIVGNIGRPGISLMLPPQAPMIRKLDENVWTNVNHAHFDGQLDNAFQNTSLHLSFSGYELTAIPHSISHGAQAVEASFVETLVSIFDRGQWVADLDILAALERDGLLRIVQRQCRHKGNIQPKFVLTSIDSWEEYLDAPPDAAIFRANGSWVARLAVSALSSWRERKIILFSDKDTICWQCITRWCEQHPQIALSAHEEGKKTPLFVC